MWYNLSLRGFNFPLSYLYKLGVYTKNVTVSLITIPVNPIVSIITPTYNRASFFEEIINSILNQDYKNIEYNN